ncbi:MAG TPA: c-type cytochrome [Rhodoferax sp.]
MDADHPNGLHVLSNRLLAIFFAGLCCLSAGAVEYSPRAQSTAKVNLPARLAEVERDPKLLAVLIKAGREVSAVCGNCHGVGGNSFNPDIPNLAGQNAVYLLEQNRQYADGLRDDKFMQGMMRAMTSDEKIGLVLFYAAEKVAPQPVSNPALAAKGKQPYNNNCASCHGEHGYGGQSVARIAGQQLDYLEEIIEHYRKGTDVLLDRKCAASIKRLTKPETDAVVAYIRSLH